MQRKNEQKTYSLGQKKHKGQEHERYSASLMIREKTVQLY